MEPAQGERDDRAELAAQNAVLPAAMEPAQGERDDLSQERIVTCVAGAAMEPAQGERDDLAAVRLPASSTRPQWSPLSESGTTS